MPTPPIKFEPLRLINTLPKKKICLIPKKKLSQKPNR